VLSPFSATIVQNSSNLRNDREFTTRGCISREELASGYGGRALEDSEKGLSRNDTGAIRLFYRYLKRKPAFEVRDGA
jgi:hypothetical protein